MADRSASPCAPPARMVLPELRPIVLDEEGRAVSLWDTFLKPPQKAGIVFFVQRRNAHSWAATGAGKTVMAIVWALAEPGPVLVITRASARRQWAREVRRFALVDPFIILPESERRAGSETLEGYLDRMAGRAPKKSPSKGSPKAPAKGPLRGPSKGSSSSSTDRSSKGSSSSSADRPFTTPFREPLRGSLEGGSFSSLGDADDDPSLGAADPLPKPPSEDDADDEPSEPSAVEDAIFPDVEAVESIPWPWDAPPDLLEGEGAIPQGRPFVIMGWDSLHDTDLYRILPRLIPGFSCVIDEIHVARNHRRFAPIIIRVDRADGSTGIRLRFQPLTSLGARCAFLTRRASRRLGLTATPIYKRIRDLWSQLDIVEPGVARRYRNFSERYCGGVEGDHGWLDAGATNLAELSAFCARRVHRIRSEEIDRYLPPFRHATTFLTIADLGPADAEASAAVRHAAAILKAAKKRGSPIGRARAALLEAELVQTAARKTKYLKATIPGLLAEKKKILIFTGRRRDVAAIADAVTDEMAVLWPASRPGPGNGWRIWATSGDDSPDVRAEIVEAYMAHPGPAMIVATGDSIGESMNLQDTDRLIEVLVPWTWGQIRQRRGRVRRLGQKRACTVETLVVEGSIEERIVSIILKDLAAIEETIPDEQVVAVREALQGGSEEEILDRLLDRILAGPSGEDEGKGEGEGAGKD